MNALSLFDNTVVWSILLLAIVSYTLLLEMILHKPKDPEWFFRTTHWLPGLQALLNSLPLLGLLGTIVGLLHTFWEMSLGELSTQALLSSGIADAMFSTQIGLLLVIPGWLMLACLKRIVRKWEVNACAKA